MKQILIETIPFSFSKNKLNENTNPTTGNPIVEGILATAEVKNGNGRLYSKDLWEREIDKYQEIVKENRGTGELDHPDSSIINLKNVSHIIREIWWDKDHIMGKIEILSTPSRNIAKELLKAGIRLGISSRGMGSVKELGEGKVVVADDFEIVCWDLVSNPSTQGAFMDNLNEGIKATTQTNKYSKINSLISDIISIM